MRSHDFWTRESVADELRSWRDHNIARNQRIAEAKSILRNLGRKDLLSTIEEPTKIGKRYAPPTPERLKAIEVGDVVRICTRDRVLDGVFIWYCLVVERCTDEEVEGVIEIYGKNMRVTLPKTYVCVTDEPAADADSPTAG
jgi:hypothetical protein